MSNVKFGFEQPQGNDDDNAPYAEGVLLATQAGFTFTPGAANVAEVAIAMKDGHGSALALSQPFLVWLSDSAAGTGLTATSASGTVQAKAASGADFAALTAKKALLVQPLATGIYTLEITDTAKTGFYVAVQFPDGRVEVSRVMTAADYG